MLNQNQEQQDEQQVLACNGVLPCDLNILGLIGAAFGNVIVNWFTAVAGMSGCQQIHDVHELPGG